MMNCSPATDLAERITKNPPHALRMAKRLLQESRTGMLESTLGMAAAMQPSRTMTPSINSASRNGGPDS